MWLTLIQCFPERRRSTYNAPFSNGEFLRLPTRVYPRKQKAPLRRPSSSPSRTTGVSGLVHIVCSYTSEGAFPGERKEPTFGTEIIFDLVSQAQLGRLWPNGLLWSKYLNNRQQHTN